MEKEKIENIVVLMIELSILILILIFDEKVEVYTSLLMFALSIVACINFSKSFSVVKMYANDLSKKIIIVAVYLIIAFQLVGYNCFNYGNAVSIEMGKQDKVEDIYETMRYIYFIFKDGTAERRLN